jgi:hypothetical protein
MGSIAVTAPESMGALSGSTLYGGVVNGFNNGALGSGLALPTLNGYVGATIATPVTGLRVGAAWDILSVNTTPSTGFLAGTKTEGEIWSLALYASYQATEKLSLHLRGEYITGDVDSPSGYTRGTLPAGSLAGDVLDNGIYAVTATVQYDLWKNVLSRLEFRWDHAEHGTMFGSADSFGRPTAENSFMLAANVIYKF